MRPTLLFSRLVFSRLVFSLIVFSLFILCIRVSTSAEEFHPVWAPHQLQQAHTFTTGQKIIGTHYFYWYDYPTQHFFDNAARTDDALQDHFIHDETVSFRSVAWHKQELEDCAAAGIDFILPVYWGVPGNYFRHGISFSIEGLPPMQRAIDELEREGKSPPKIGLFYDTSTLLPGMRGVVGRNEKYDLTKSPGKEIFYQTIRDFFYQVQPKHWACVDGKPIVVLYGSGFVKKHGQVTIDYVYEQFANDFHGIKPYIIKDTSWQFESDAETSWGAALNGPNIFDNIAQIGPGYNDTAVPGRSTPVREREDGNFYRLGWNQILESNANIVLIETWNEMHEGTDICASKEFGRQYIDLTAKYARTFKNKETLNEDITLEYPKLRPRPANNKGSEYKDETDVRVLLGDGGSNQGVWLVRGQPDGPVSNAMIGDVPCAQSIEADNTYVYFNVADPFFFDDTGMIALTIRYWDDGFNSASLQYDSYDDAATLDGAYTTHSLISSSHSKRWKLHTFYLDNARFVNRQNGGADFRFSVNGQLSIAEIVVTKIES